MGQPGDNAQGPLVELLTGRQDSHFINDHRGGEGGGLPHLTFLSRHRPFPGAEKSKLKSIPVIYSQLTPGQLFSAGEGPSAASPWP